MVFINMQSLSGLWSYNWGKHCSFRNASMYHIITRQKNILQNFQLNFTRSRNSACSQLLASWLLSSQALQQYRRWNNHLHCPQQPSEISCLSALFLQHQMSREAGVREHHPAASRRDAFMVEVQRDIEGWGRVSRRQSEGGAEPARHGGRAPRWDLWAGSMRPGHPFWKNYHPVIPSKAVKVGAVAWTSPRFLYTSVFQGAGKTINQSVSHQITWIQISGQLIFFLRNYLSFQTILTFPHSVHCAVFHFLNYLISRSLNNRNAVVKVPPVDMTSVYHVAGTQSHMGVSHACCSRLWEVCLLPSSKWVDSPILWLIFVIVTFYFP